KRGHRRWTERGHEWTERGRGCARRGRSGGERGGRAGGGIGSAGGRPPGGRDEGDADRAASEARRGTPQEAAVTGREVMMSSTAHSRREDAGAIRSRGHWVIREFDAVHD